MREFKKNLYRCIIAIALLLIPFSTVLAQNNQNLPGGGNGNILVLNGFQHGFPVADAIARGFAETMSEAGVRPDAVYVKYLDFHRNQTAEHRENMLELMTELSEEHNIRLIVAVDMVAINFLVHDCRDLFSGVPLITYFDKDLQWVGLPRPLINIASDNDAEGTLRYALDLFPRTERVLLIMGRDDVRGPFLEGILTALDRQAEGIIVEDTSRLAYAEMLEYIATIPADTIAFYGSYFEDVTGQTFTPAYVARHVGQTASVPVFAFIDMHIMQGLVGGSVMLSSDLGRQAAEIGLDYFAGRLVLGSERTVFEPLIVPLFDWPQLRRWGADPNRLPENSIFLNYEPSLWIEYRPLITLAGFSMLALLILSSLLLTKNRKLITAVTELDLSEKEHKRNRERLANIIKATNVGTWELNLKTGGAEFNERWAEMIGYTLQELSPTSTETWERLTHPEDLSKCEAQLQESGYGEREYYDIEFRMKHKQGHYIWVHARGKIISRTTDGEALILGGTLAEITSRKLIEEELRHNEERYRSIIAVSNTGAWEYYCDQNYLWCSPEYFEMLGYDRSEYDNTDAANITRAWSDFLHPEDKDSAVLKFADYLSSRSCDLYENYFRLKHKNGNFVWILSRGRTLCDANGNPSNLTIGTHINVSKLKEIEQALHVESEYLEKLISNANAPIVVWDKDFEITRVNGAFENLVGRMADEVLGKSVEILFSEDQRGKTLKLLAGTKIGKYLESEEVDIVRADGSVRTILLNSAAIYDQDGIALISTIAQGQDITERKRAEENLVHLSYHDMLTGLYNRRFFEAEIKRMDTATNLPISIVVADLNGLKFVNDSFGHAAGDELLKKAAELLNAICRPGDILARVGGDEFVLLLPKTDESKAAQIVEHLNAQVIKENELSVTFSISFGYETKNNLDEQIEEIYKKAENQMYRHKLHISTSIRGKTIDLIMNALFEKSKRETTHSKRVSEICEVIACKMKLNTETVRRIKAAGLVHDIGKIGISENVLNKPHGLNDAEWEAIKKHPEAGWRILSSAVDFSELANFILEHHERWDGKGYPRGLSGEEISIEARIIAIADAFDAMTSERTYRKVLSIEEAKVEMIQCSGKQFDPRIAQLFVEKVINNYE